MITGTQIRSARAALRWTSEDLAEKAGITSRTVKRLEQFNGIPDCRSTTLLLIKKVIEAAGIEFIGSAENGPGVRLWKKETLKQL
jgi:transcriptional regulator with XRE-family HTH domain